MRIIQSPEIYTNFSYLNMLFLAGGISNCPDWQGDLCNRYKQYDGSLSIFNPRRVGDLCKNGSDAKEQIEWEHLYLSKCHNILFWFPEETVCPISLFELGKYAQKFSGYINKKLFIGIHPNYSRKFDLEIQLPLIIPKIEIYNSLDDLFNATVEEFKLTKWNLTDNVKLSN